MIKGKNILCMPLTTWDSDFPNTVVTMMKILSRENRILFVDYQYSLKDIFNSVRGKKKVPVKRVLGSEDRLRKVTTDLGSELYVLNPLPVLPSNGITSRSLYKKVLQLNAGIIKFSIQRALEELGMKEDLIVVNGYNPFTGLPLKGSFDEMLHVYYCYDEMKGDVWFNHGALIEEEYLKKADLVITTSDALNESKSCLNKNCYVVKNGVDFHLFNSVSGYSPNNERKKVGYTGSVDERFDIDLMSFVIENNPQFDFEFLGRITNPQAKRVLEKFSNVRFLGAAKPDEVPSYLKTVDCCIIPYLRNDVTWGVYPLKINEYLAAGKPVVMTHFAPLKEFESIVSITNEKQLFSNRIQKEIYEDNSQKKSLRIALAKNNSWENRVEEFSGIIQKQLLKEELV